jgi:hypothetical protein
MCFVSGTWNELECQTSKLATCTNKSVSYVYIHEVIFSILQSLYWNNIYINQMNVAYTQHNTTFTSLASVTYLKNVFSLLITISPLKKSAIDSHTPLWQSIIYSPKCTPLVSVYLSYSTLVCLVFHLPRGPSHIQHLYLYFGQIQKPWLRWSFSGLDCM